MGVARCRRARGRRRVRDSAGAVAHSGHGEDAVLADRLLLQGPGDPRRVLAGDLAARHFRLLVSVATLKLAGDDVRAAPLGRIGQGLVLWLFPACSRRLSSRRRSPSYQLHPDHSPSGLRHRAVCAGVGRACAGRSSVVNLPGRLASAPPFAVAMALGGFVYILALICFGVATTLLAHAGELASREEMFWGGGHVLQFVYAALMVTNWSILARMSLGEKAVDNRIFLGSVGLIALIAIAAPAFYVIFAPFSDHQREAFRFLQFGIAAPTLIFAISLVARARRSPGPWPWRDPAFFALAMSLALFALGGMMGFLIDGSDTRTPAHYHAVITAVSVSSAGMLLTYGLKELGKPPAPPARRASS